MSNIWNTLLENVINVFNVFKMYLMYLTHYQLLKVKIKPTNGNIN